MMWRWDDTASCTSRNTCCELFECAILFQDDFSKPANGWTATKTDYGEFGYVDGEYRILLSKPDFNTYSLLPNQSFDNCSVEVDVRLADGPSNGVFGILCRVEAE